MRFKVVWHWFAVCSLLGISLISGFFSFFINPPEILITDDGAAKWEARMQAVRAHLPASVEEVGYISESENLGSKVEEYLLTKYALIPVVVHQGTDYEWVIGNFTQPDFQQTLDAQIPGNITIKKLGAGIYLIHRSYP